MASSSPHHEIFERLRVMAGEREGGSALLRTLDVPDRKGGLDRKEEGEERLPLGIEAFDSKLPAGGLPQGVVELAAPEGLARSTQLALLACASAQRRARRREAPSWCAWIDASRSLYAPGVAQQGVDLTRLLVVQPPAEEIAKVGIRLVGSGLFSLIVIDRCGAPGARLRAGGGAKQVRWGVVVRKLALAAERHGAFILLLSELRRARRDALPTSMRLELTRPDTERLVTRVVKERRGRLPAAWSIPLTALQGRREDQPGERSSGSHPASDSRLPHDWGEGGALARSG